ncbi:MAG: hypothetical protein WCK91_00065 [bacterium]
MIYILAGNDTKKKGARARAIVSGTELTVLQVKDLTPESLSLYAMSTSLFGTTSSVQLENIIKSGFVFSLPLLKNLQDSETNFLFMEDKLLAADEKKYQKYATIEKFEEKVIKQAPKINVFTIADAYERKDKIGAWASYVAAIESGIEPEAISGILFWKIKTMVIGNSRVFSRDSLVSKSSSIVSLYHRAHRGEVDFTIGLEQFILSSLS